nr:quinone-dependent dihydroorotate dehydrogenase [uncultured Sphingosinicella sp.]
MALYPLLRPLLFSIEEEAAHRLTIASLKLMPRGRTEPHPRLRIRVAGLDFPNPIGLAAGFDKNGEVFGQILRLGFGFTEVGTLTPRPQAGNPQPRLFRLPEDRALINRLGFNNQGQEAARPRLAKRRRGGLSTSLRTGIVGINIGANKDSSDRIADYAQGARAMAPIADYLAVNISSPNTPGLRALQDRAALDELLAAVMEVRGDTPVFLKVAPDLERADIDDVAIVASDRKVDALIVSNTTITRPKLKSRFREETGGLSGAPLNGLALQRLRDFRSATGGAIPLIGVGGVGSGQDAFERIRAGASLVQLYTAFVYSGPALARTMARDLRRLLRRHGFRNVAEAVGTEGLS